MSQFFYIHPENPQARLIRQVVSILHRGGVIVYPTDSSYALACRIGDKAALERIRRIRRLDDKHHFTLMCRDLSDLGLFAHVDNNVFRLLKRLIPGPYTFLLQASREVPRRLQHPKKKSIGLRVPSNQIALAILQELAEPLMSTSLLMPNEEYPMQNPDDIRDMLEPQVDVIIHGGMGGVEPTTVIDLVGSVPELVREGKGDFTAYL